MRIKDLTNLQYLAKGRYGTYFQVSKIGYKIVGKGFKSMFSMRQSLDWSQTVLEYSYYLMARKSGITPKMVQLMIAYYKGKYYPCIKMSHIDGIPLNNIDHWKKGQLKGTTLNLKNSKNGKKILLNDKKIEEYLKKILYKKTGLIHQDLHTNNILITKNGKLHIIDFSPDHIIEDY